MRLEDLKKGRLPVIEILLLGNLEWSQNGAGKNNSFGTSGP